MFFPLDEPRHLLLDQVCCSLPICLEHHADSRHSECNTKGSTLPSNKTSICHRVKALHGHFAGSISPFPTTTNNVLFCSVPQQAGATCNNQTLHSSSTRTAIDTKAWRTLSSYHGSCVVFKDSPRPEPGHQSTQSCCGSQSWAIDIWVIWPIPLCNRHQHPILRMSKSRWSLPSINTLSTSNSKWHHHSSEHSTAMHKCSKTDQFRRGTTIIIGPGSKQDIYLSMQCKFTKQFLHIRKHAHKLDAIFWLRM